MSSTMNNSNREEVTPLIQNTTSVVSSTSINNGNYQQQDTTLIRRNVSPSTLERADIGKDYYTDNHSNRSSSSDLSNLEKQPIYKAKGTKKQKFLFHFFNISCPLFIVVLVALGLGVGLIFILSRTQTEVQPTGTRAAVASDSTICSEMGLKVIKEKKGNAVDAAIVVALCLGVTRPFASGIGGGGFITIFMNETKTVDFINSRETAPSAASQDMYENNYDESVFGGKSIAVYGEIRGLHTAHKLYGKLPWKELFTDVINIARNGWIVEPLLAVRLSQDDILKFPTLVQFTTIGSDGKRRVYHEGELIKRTDLANTLEKIASDGPNILYEGPIAQKIVEEIQQQGGIITLDDLKNYQPERPFYDENPIISQKDMTLELNDFKVILPPPPSAGPVIKFILSILNNFKIGDNSPMGLNYHYILEALKFGFGHRSNLGDVNFLPKENVTKYIINQLLSDSYASSIASERVSPSRTFPWSHYYSDNYAPVKDKGTSHFSVIDEDGNSVAMTTTVNHNFGSKVASASTGIVFNNQMNDFTVDLHKPNQFGLPPSAANVIAPGKRPLSSMSPAIFLDKSGNRVKYIIGASGGPTIISAIIEVFYSIEKFKVQPNLAVALPRLHAQPGSDVVKMEEGFNRQVITALQEKGHAFEPVQILPDGHTIGCCQVIQVSSTENDQNLFLPGTDPRKLGSPACF